MLPGLRRPHYTPSGVFEGMLFWWQQLDGYWLSAIVTPVQRTLILLNTYYHRTRRPTSPPLRMHWDWDGLSPEATLVGRMVTVLDARFSFADAYGSVS